MKNEYVVRDGIATIQLTQGQVTLVSKDDLAKMAPYRWCTAKFDARDAYAAAKTKYALEGGVSSTTMS